jgi:NAD(P)-dependent dehydrogenase (short-subunit alcohol dehydrogenase family)
MLTRHVHIRIDLTKSAALDYAGQGIRVNAVCPGCIDMPMGDAIDPAAMKKFFACPADWPDGLAGEVAAVVPRAGDIWRNRYAIPPNV